jgi:hypothetical protein
VGLSGGVESAASECVGLDGTSGTDGTDGASGGVAPSIVVALDGIDGIDATDGTFAIWAHSLVHLGGTTSLIEGATVRRNKL